MDKEFYTVKGESLPRVTHVLGMVGDKQFLINWAVNEAVGHIERTLEPLKKTPYQIPHILPETLAAAKKRHLVIRDSAGDRGKAIHKLLERKLKGEEVDYRPYEGDKVITKALKQLDSWIAEWEFTPLTYTTTIGAQDQTVEVQVSSDTHKYAGTADAIGRNKDGQLMLIDLKTGKSTHRSMEIQMAAYCMAYGEQTGDYPDICMVLHTLPSGTIRAKHIMNRKQYEQRFELFLHALPLYEFYRTR
jgi:hypothetical protein